MLSSHCSRLTLLLTGFVLLFFGSRATEAGVSPYAGKLLLTEVSTKTSDDKLEIYVVDGSVDFTGFEVYKGTTLRFTFPADWHTNGLKTGDYIVLSQSLGSNDVVKSDNNPAFWDGILSGYLASTDDVVWIADTNGDFVDVVIWSDLSGSFTGSKAKANAAAADGMWDSYDFSSGDAGAWTDTDDLGSNQTISRYMNTSHTGYVDSNSRTDWYLCTNPSLGSENDQSLPVFLTSFTAEATPGGVLLKWATASETGCLGFNLFRSERENSGYEQIAGLIQGGGNSASGREYRYLDDGVVRGQVYFYRLEDVALDGSRTLHPPVSVLYDPGADRNAAMPGDFVLDEVYPNPFSPALGHSQAVLGIHLSDDEAGKGISVSVYDLLGRKIRQMQGEAVPGGRFVVRWDGREDDGREAASGVYYWVVEWAGKRKCRRVLLLR